MNEGIILAKSQIDNLQLDMFGTNIGSSFNDVELPITVEVPVSSRGNGGFGPSADRDVSTSALATGVIDTVKAVDTSILSSGVVAEIKDAGEELTYNRRNRIKTAKRWVDIADLNDTLKAKEAVKANVWPKPDYKKLIEDGMQPMVAHIVKQIYDSVAIKPIISGGTLLNDVSLQLYISAINRVESGVMQWAQDPIALQQWAEANARIAGAMLGKPITISSLVGESKSLQDFIYPEGWKHYREELIIVGGNKLLSALQPRYDEINRAIKAIAKGWPEKREAWEVQGFRVLDNPEIEVHKSPYNKDKFLLGVDNKFIKTFDSMEEADTAAAAIKPFVLFGKRGMLNSFASEEEAIAAARELSGRDKGNSIGEKGIRVEAAERVGIHRRMEGENITSERLAEEFGFKGVNFGNWLKTPSARAEAQLHLNHAFDSAHDLADILGIPPKAISLNGMLGLAIGAQGGGGNAAAHFVPGVNEINLTRTSGTGSLAHEWAHAMDHYFAAQGGLATSSEPFLTEHARLNSLRTVVNKIDGKWITSQVPRFGDLRPEVVTAFNTIVKSMNERAETEDEAKAGRIDHLANAKSSLGKWLDALRRDFVGQEAEFDKLAGRARVGDFGDGQLVIGRNTYIAPVVGAIRDLYKEKHGRVYSIDKSKGLQSSIDSFSYWASKEVTEEDHVPQMVATSYAKNARALDREKRGKPYWSTTLEKFARAFDAFVSDELEAREAKNSYLSHAGRLDETVPSGGERENINDAFRALIGEVKTRETEKGVALFSMAMGDQFIADPRFIATTTALSKTSTGMPIAEIKSEIDRLKIEWAAMPRVTIVKSADMLPFDALAHADGAYYDGQVFVVADNIHDLKQLQKVMAHECILHHSLEEMLGDYGFSKVHAGIQGLKTSGDPVVSALAKDILERYGVLPPESETKEIIARAGEQCLDETGNLRIGFGFMKSVYAGVAGWLRDQGFKIPFTNVELQGIMHSAGEWIHQDRNQEWSGSHYLVPAHSLAKVGSYSGKVLDIKDGVMTQKTGRSGETTSHDIFLLSVEVKIGDIVDIKYKSGVGKVTSKALSVNQER